MSTSFIMHQNEYVEKVYAKQLIYTDTYVVSYIYLINIFPCIAGITRTIWREGRDWRCWTYGECIRLLCNIIYSAFSCADKILK